ncbi:MAG: hypothetical protein RI897_2365 [Verrucomicrobiota bacterium]
MVIVAGDDALAGFHDEERMGIPFTVDPMLEEAHVPFDFLEVPAVFDADGPDVFVEVEGFSEFEIDEDAVGVVFGPALHDFEQLAGLFLAVLFHPVFEGGVTAGAVIGAVLEVSGVAGGDIGAATADAFEPAGGVEVGAGEVFAEFLVTVTGTEEERDAVVGFGNDEPRVAGLEPAEEITAEGVAEQDGVVFICGNRVDAFLEGFASQLRSIVQALGDELGVDDVDRA